MTFLRQKFEIDLPRGLALTPDEAAALPWDARVARVGRLQKLSGQILGQAREIAETDHGPRDVVSVAALVSGGRDSVTMLHVMREHLTHIVFADTGTGVTVTREFIRKVASDTGLPFIEARAPRAEDSYDVMVRERGFPGPGMHGKMYNRLKERAFRQARRELITDGRTQRVIFVAGRRRSESARRATVPELEREDSVVFCSPMVLWTRPDLNAYGRLHDVPVNPVYEMLHLSGECLCGCFAQEGEREWTFGCLPDDPAIRRLRALEDELADRDDIPPGRRIWGCGGQARACPAGECNE